MQAQRAEQIGQHLLQRLVHVALALLVGRQQVADLGARGVTVHGEHHADAEQRAVHGFAPGQVQLGADGMGGKIVIDLFARLGRSCPGRVVPPAHHVRVRLHGRPGNSCEWLANTVVHADGRALWRRRVCRWGRMAPERRDR
ncbi:hypothetical protein G6F62_013990 [Rhizopus arrhizus]|nr:hypothetical protein G6F62_013990 [Rhizopus arrhizus]